MQFQTNPIQFKFKYVRNNQASGVFSQKGLLDHQGLTLAQNTISYHNIAAVQILDNRLVLVLSDVRQLSDKAINLLINNNILVIEVYKTNTLELKVMINRVLSQKEAEAIRQQLISNDRSNFFAIVNCPQCQATIDQSERERTRYIYCRFCETIFQPGSPLITNGMNYRICGDCNMFDRISGYTEFYFYFLLVVYGFSYKRRHVCDNCANRIFWKTLFANLIFVLGVPFSIYVKIKSMIGRDANLQELAKANSLASKGKYQEAAVIYSRLQQNYPEHPGLLLSQGLGHLTGNDIQGAINCFNRSLKACNNYSPAVDLISRLQQAAKSQVVGRS
ncbi:MAG: hypothetical protein AB1489_37750 [Acidobacteriota bacterium]